MGRLRELELEVRAAEMNRDEVNERYELIDKEYKRVKREYEDLHALKIEKGIKLFEARKTLFYYKEEQK